MASRWQSIPQNEKGPDKARPFLLPTDECYYLGDYISGGGYAASKINQLIFNLKKPPHAIGRSVWEYGYKQNAIAQVAQELAEALNFENIGSSVTLIPIPPSKTRGHPEYDDRMMQVCRQIRQQHAPQVEVIDAIEMGQDIGSYHAGGRRLRPKELERYLRWTVQPGQTLRRYVLLVDDVITQGAHFRACHSIVSQHAPQSKIIGLFVARTVWI